MVAFAQATGCFDEARTVKVLVTGAGGQLGLDLLDEFAEHQPMGLTHVDLDVGDDAAVRAAIAEHDPALVVNAAAWTAVDACEADPDRAHRVNALGPWWLARACAARGATLVQVSTDYVFAGDPPSGPSGRLRGWNESDPVSPINEYGRSKAAGEQLVRQALPEHHIVRTSWLSGARGANFVRTMLRLAEEREHLDVVDDEYGCPTFTRALARAIRRLCDSGRYGTVHLANEGHCSWYDLAIAVFELAGLDIDVRRTTAAAFGRPAQRSSWSVLDSGHARSIGVGPLPHWREGLHELVAELGIVGAPHAALSSAPVGRGLANESPSSATS
jgi:dTDP-4-dehydrorhamnose reductase